MLEVRHLSKRFEQRQLLTHLDLQVQAGEIVALLGPSGSGKSTLLRILAGLDTPDGGSVWMDGQNITALAPEQRGFALMFQDFALFPHMDVRDNVAFGLIEQKIPRREARAQATQLLERFGLGAQVAQRIWTLSGGEQQRVALARALITRPRALLLDEPFSALDAELRLRLQEDFRQRIQEAGMATVLVTHDETEARVMAVRGWRLNHGQLSQLW